MDAIAMGCEAKALQRSLPDEALTFDEPIALPNGGDAPMT